MSEEKIGIYTIGPKIGKGSFATVYKCIDNKTNKSVAIKSVVRSKLNSKKLIENLEIEISILKTIKHPHIVGLLDYNRTPTYFHLVMDYCSMGDLSYFIRKRSELTQNHPVISSILQRYPSPEGSHGLNDTVVIHFLKQLASALEFLRDKSLVHRDIKPQNLLLCPPSHSKQEFIDGHFVGLWELPLLKIADFGFARFLPSTSMAETLCGSPLYMAPEILRYEKYNAKADLWSVGAVLYEMTVGKPPFKAENHIELIKNIENAHDKIRFPVSAQVPAQLKTLIRSLLKYNPTERVSFNEFFNDDLIVGDLQSVDEPLDTSEMDENLFISEYISPGKARDIKGVEMTPFKASKSDKFRDEEIKQIIQKQHPGRDEQIKQIINQNSPGPETLSNSIQPRAGALVIRNKSDITLEKDYVVVEKRAVEVNAIADELAHAGSGALAINARRSLSISSGESNKSINRRYSLRSNSTSSQGRPNLAERRISISISPSNALSKAIGLASHRLFGTNNVNQLIDETNEKLVLSSQDTSFLAVISSPNFTNHLLLQKLNIPTSSTIAAFEHLDMALSQYSSDELVLNKLESIATKAHAINLFADVKFSQLIPSPPSSDGLEDEVFLHNFSLPPKMIKTISEEGVVLYVKTLSLLAKGMLMASEWWSNQSEDGIDSKVTNNSISVKINELVQWIREKFNESLEKAEFIRLRLEEANAAITKEKTNESTDYFFNSGDIDSPPTKVIAEKLIFDRALEMSRNAAVNELVKEDLKGCELAYSTAIWMLEALLDEEIGQGGPDDERLDSEDRATVEKFIISIGNRLSVLKRKLQVLV